MVWYAAPDTGEFKSPNRKTGQGDVLSSRSNSWITSLAAFSRAVAPWSSKCVDYINPSFNWSYKDGEIMSRLASGRFEPKPANCTDSNACCIPATTRSIRMFAKPEISPWNQFMDLCIIEDGRVFPSLVAIITTNPDILPLPWCMTIQWRVDIDQLTMQDFLKRNYSMSCGM